jgi:hypothetical protein
MLVLLGTAEFSGRLVAATPTGSDEEATHAIEAWIDR